MTYTKKAEQKKTEQSLSCFTNHLPKRHTILLVRFPVICYLEDAAIHSPLSRRFFMNSISYKRYSKLLPEGFALLWIQAHIRNQIMTPILVNVTRLGNHGFIWIVIASILFLREPTRVTGLLSFSALIGSLLINNLFVKRMVARIRPYDVIPELKLLIDREKDLSFPSGHTSCAFAMATVLYLCLPQNYGIMFLFFAFLMGLSRLYVGAHYPSDVLAGGLIGSFIGIMTCFFLEWPLSTLVALCEAWLRIANLS